MNFIKNKFVFILLISAVTLGALILGAMTLYKDNDLSFSSDGYIISATTKSNKKYYFSANTKYKENVDEQIIFNDVDDKKVAVDPASFVHYSNGDVTFLKKGALVNLSELNSAMINYYNITNKNTIKYKNGSYVVSSNNKEINIESFIGRISDDKYLISGNSLSLKVPQNEELIPGEYFEVLFIEDGIIKIDNEKASYQVTAQDSFIYVGDNVVINLGTGRILYDNSAKMLLSQITISGDENINLDVDDKNSAGGGGGGGSGSGTGEGDGDGDGEGEDSEGIEGTEEAIPGEGEGTAGNGTGEGEGEGTGEGGTGSGEGDGSGGTGGSGGTDATLSVQLELIEAKITATTIDLTMQLNNAKLAKGKLLYYFTNISTGEREGNSEYIDLVNGTFEISQESLSPSTDYSFTIIETTNDGSKQYFQKTFTTKDLGIILEKIYSTDSSLSYKLNFEDNAEVTKARVSIFDSNGDNSNIQNNQITVSKSDIGKEIVFSGLKSNTTYSVSVDMVWINNAAYSNVYSINRLDTTLKKTPIISGVKVDANAEEVKFDIKLDKVNDPDKSIEKYIYNIYLADDITPDNLNPEVQYTVTKNDSDDLILNLNEISELRTGVDYRCKIYAQYNDNEMIREVSTEYSSNFLIKSKPKITFELKSATMNKVEGTLKLLDANCTVPMSGRACDGRNNNFTLRYYKLTEDETNKNDMTIKFKPETLSTDLKLENLESNTTFAVKVFGSYYDDDDVLHENVQIGDTFFVSTDKSENIYFVVSGDNESGVDDVSVEKSSIVTFQAKLEEPQNSNLKEEISTITLNLYSGRYNTKDKLIGKYEITDTNKIQDFFNSMTITNKLFTDVTGNRLGYIDTLTKLIKATHNATNTLNNYYTVEVEDVYDSSGKNKITVENNVYTFKLTPSYYLDARIAKEAGKYVTVTPITKGGLWGTNKEEASEEYLKLLEDVENLDVLADDTVVGVTIQNSLSDILVDSAFAYEKVTVNYIVYNNVSKHIVKTVPLDMGNKYQPKEQEIYLDYSKLDDGGKTYFTRGYKFNIGFELVFDIGEGEVITYTHDELYKTLSIEKQKPTYMQYIFSSDDNGVTYKYSFTDVDDVITDKNFYYSVGKTGAGQEIKYNEIKNALKKDGEIHEVTVPVGENNDYSLYYAMIDTDGNASYTSISDYIFEKEFKYDDSVSYSIVDDSSNILKLKLENNDFTSRAFVYKVTIKADGIDTYTRYFLADKLGVLEEDTGEVDDKGKAVMLENKYIGIDYANIIDFMGHDMDIQVTCYYDSGLVGINQDFTDGMVLKNYATGKYFNTFYRGTGANNKVPISGEGVDMGGLYRVRNGFNIGDPHMFIYNHLIYTKDEKFEGFSIGFEQLSKPDVEDVGIEYKLNYTSDGIVFIDGKKEYKGYNFRKANEINLVTDDNNYRFDTIIPSINVTTKNTINSIKLDIDTTGVYGNKQFLKDGKAHNKIYVTFYKDAEFTEENKLETIDVDVNITSTGSGYEANVDEVVYSNLKPNTTYYYTVSAYINNKETRLFDSNVKGYKAVDYVTNTLDAKGIFQGIRFLVKPSAYNGENFMSTLTWKVSLKNTENYRLRMELYRPDGTVVDPDTGEEKTNYKAVNFDGTDASSCNIDSYGTVSTAYINGCYINANQHGIDVINKKNFEYKFSNNIFVYGGKYYKLVVYAVPYTNGEYVEDDKVILYQNDSLSTAKSGAIDITDYYDISIPELLSPTFYLDNTLAAGSIDNGDGKPSDYYISFTPRVKDEFYVLKNGTYTIRVMNSDYEVVKEIKDVNILSGKNYQITGLDSNSLYHVELSYSAYRNNVGYTEEEKISSTPFTTFTYTPVNNNITLGSITARYLNSNTVVLAYNGASNLSEKITKVGYTITVNGIASKVSGTFVIGDNVDNIFTVNSDKIPRFTINVADTTHSNNPAFTFTEGNTYIISTVYYYYDAASKQYVALMDKDGKSNYTTMLNL